MQASSSVYTELLTAHRAVADCTAANADDLAPLHKTLVRAASENARLSSLIEHSRPWQPDRLQYFRSCHDNYNSWLKVLLDYESNRRRLLELGSTAPT